MFERIKLGVEEELLKIQDEISQFEIQNDLWLNDNVWEDWFDSFKLHFNKICKYKKFEDKRKFITEYIDKIDVSWDKNNNTHNIQIHFILNLIKDKGELINKDIYKIKGGKNILNIDGINLRKFKNEISKKKEYETTFYNYSTVKNILQVGTLPI